MRLPAQTVREVGRQVKMSLAPLALFWVLLSLTLNSHVCGCFHATSAQMPMDDLPLPAAPFRLLPHSIVSPVASAARGHVV